MLSMPAVFPWAFFFDWTAFDRNSLQGGEKATIIKVSKYREERKETYG